MKASTDRTVRRPPPAATGWGRRGFTLIELLTIVVILGTLISLTTPSILEVKKIFATRESVGRMNLIESGIRMYASDWKQPPSYKTDPAEIRAWNPLPPSAAGSYPTQLKGRTGLAQALTGYLPKGDSPGDGTGTANGDGADGWGSRKVVPGRVLGPYVGPEQPMGPSDPDNPSSAPAFLDAFGNNFYYYRAHISGTGTGAKIEYKATDNDTPPGPTDLNMYLRPRQDSNQRLYRVDYVLISPGADRAWEAFPAGKKKTDDIANFDFEFK
jgi:prepilin-type N-terminal cleavage/methylation domain-containing protein